MRATREATACYHCHFLARQLAGSMPYATLRAEQDGLGPSDNDIWAGHQVSPNILILSINSIYWALFSHWWIDYKNVAELFRKLSSLGLLIWYWKAILPSVLTSFGRKLELDLAK